MPLTLGLGPILVIGPVVEDYVVMDELDITRPEFDIEIV